MLSALSWTTLALTVLAAASPALANELDTDLAARDVTGFSENLLARQILTKRRANHADEFGYPHHSDSHHHHHKHMTPGGFHDPKPSNLGEKCHRDWECHTHIGLAAGACINGRCSFVCLGDTVQSGNTCVGTFYEHSCSAKRHDHCKTKVEHADPICLHDKCTFACKTGYYASGTQCLPTREECGGHKCHTVVGGSNTCHRGECKPQCPTYLGYKLYANQKKTAYKCVNTQTDPDHCGGVGHEHTCVAGYNGKGKPTCHHGHCELECGHLHKVHPRHGAPYCA